MNPIPWYESPVMKAAATAFLTQLLAFAPKLFLLLGITNDAQIASLVSVIFELGGLVGTYIVIHIRATSPIQPKTNTKTTADAKATPLTQQATDVTAYSIQSKGDAK